MFQAKYNTGVEDISLPTSWHEVTFKQYCELVNNDGDWIRRIAILTGLSDEDVSRFSTDLFTIMVSRVSFLNNVDELINAIHVPEEYKNFKVGSVDIGDFIKAQQEIERVDNELKSRNPEPTDEVFKANRVNAGARIVKLFTAKKFKDYEVPGWSIENEPVTKVLGLVNFFLLALESS